MIVDSIEGLDENSQFIRLNKAFPRHDVYLKLEGLNTAGSVKLKTAISLVDSLEEQGTLKKGGWLVESSSGSLGIALAAVAARRGYRLSIVTDLNANPKSIAHMRALGAEVEVIEQRDSAGGFLGTRLARVQELTSSSDGPLWTNQYSNQANPFVHSSKTYRAIVDALGDPDCIFVGAGTTGTLMGVCRGVATSMAATRVYAVDSVGSVTFGGTPSRRHIPGLGASVPPPLFDTNLVLEQHAIDEIDAVRQCRRVARLEGFLPGGSTGTVLAGLDALQDVIPENSRIVVISPDMGERYLDSIYNEKWAVDKFGPTVLDISRHPTVHTIKTSQTGRMQNVDK